MKIVPLLNKSDRSFQTNDISVAIAIKPTQLQSVLKDISRKINCVPSLLAPAAGLGHLG